MAEYSVTFPKLKISEDSLSLSSKSLYDYENRISSTVNGIPATIMNSLNIRNKLSTLSKRLESSAMGFENLSKGMSLINLKYQQTENVVVEGKAYLEKNKPDIFGDYKKQSIINGTTPRTIVNGDEDNATQIQSGSTPISPLPNGIYNRPKHSGSGRLIEDNSETDNDEEGYYWKNPGFYNKNEDILDTKYKSKKINNIAEEKGLREKGGPGSSYVDMNGDEVSKEEADFKDVKLTLMESGWKDRVGYINLKGDEIDTPIGKLTPTIGKAEAYYALLGSANITGNDNGNDLGMGLYGAFGANITLAELELKSQLIGNENNGIDLTTKVVAGKAGIDAQFLAQITGKDGRFDPQFVAEAKVGATILGVEATGKVNLGGNPYLKLKLEGEIGAELHGKLGYKDNFLMIDAGFAYGVGGSVGVEVDPIGLVGYYFENPEKFWSDLGEVRDAVAARLFE